MLYPADNSGHFKPTTGLYIPFAGTDSAFESKLVNTITRFPGTLIILFENLILSEAVPVKTVVYPTGPGSHSDIYGTLYKIMFNEVMPLITDRFQSVNHSMLCNLGEDLFTSFILEQYPKTFNAYTSFQPFLVFDGNELSLAKKYFSNISAYKNIASTNLSVDEKNWPDRMLVKMGVELPIWMQE